MKLERLLPYRSFWHPNCRIRLAPCRTTWPGQRCTNLRAETLHTHVFISIHVISIQAERYRCVCEFTHTQTHISTCPISENTQPKPEDNCAPAACGRTYSGNYSHGKVAGMLSWNHPHWRLIIDIKNTKPKQQPKNPTKNQPTKQKTPALKTRARWSASSAV